MSLKKYYQKKDQVVSALQLSIPDCRVNYKKWGDEQSAKEGDWLVNHNGDTYTVDQESFSLTYQHLHDNQYRKTAPVWAETAMSAGKIATKEGTTRYQAGDMLVYNNPDKTDGYAIAATKFATMYEKADKKMENTTMLAQDYLEQRVNDQIQWYENKAAANQRSYKRCQLWAIIFGAAIPLLTAISFEELEMLLRFVIALLGSLIAIMNAVLSLYKFQENWAQYRGTAEALTREKLLFITQAAPYEGNQTENFKHFVERCEGIMASENSSWLKQVTPSAKPKAETTKNK